jgi:hypothetical protein
LNRHGFGIVGGGAMGDARLEEESRKVEEWLLAILRFAITREKADRAAVLATASAMDSFGVPPVHSGFTFFVRTSTEICDLIAGGNNTANEAALHHQLSKIDNDRLRRALIAAVEIERPATARTGKLGRRYGDDLWRGLPIRR